MRIRPGYNFLLRMQSREKMKNCDFNTGNLEYVLTLFIQFTDLFFFCLDDCQCKARHSVKSRPQAPIYEEMTGVQPLRCKLPLNHLEEMETSEYRNCHVKKSYPENHYESPTGALRPRTESQKWNVRASCQHHEVDRFINSAPSLDSIVIDWPYTFLNLMYIWLRLL